MTATEYTALGLTGVPSALLTGIWSCAADLMDMNSLQVGRAVRPRGDGSFEFHADPHMAPGKRLEATKEESVTTFSVQAFTDLTAVSWDRSSALTKLLTIACVCNKAKFTVAEESSTTPGEPD